ncbi:ABC transporter permease [Dyadobacter chenwenxiniae]|uniref:ABC transporter permease n=1 Tax=Dyadobacter chenwenxiniae TaxID=2906456 RepID=A0A9X1PRF7_9BACT|nr:ABC transporter permease [Dyadobacter chenwenxiniae]MCF0065648.1 ABC transporter permease [Dyadobacter chenwenxiniae]UON85559.1 ABC transporter permease [Dyadobacter chenwenxiniae]
MFRSYLVITLRNLKKNKLLSVINILGLSIGVSACLFILQYVSFELSYESKFLNYDSIYRITSEFYDKGEKTSESALTTPHLKADIQTNFPEIEACTQLLSTRSWFDCTLKNDKAGSSKIFNERNVFFTDNSFIDFFSITLKEGNSVTALQQPNSMVLSESAAKRYFGLSDPIGQSLTLNGSMHNQSYIVTGLMPDLPQNSHLADVDILASISSIESTPNLKNSELYNYLRLKSYQNISSLKSRFKTFAAKYSNSAAGLGGSNSTYELQPIKEIYLYSHLEDEMHVGGNPDSIYFLLIIAVFILLIAWINYVNLATSRSSERAKEVAVRKVSGANSLELVPQFLLESLLINLIGIALSVICVKAFSDDLYSFIGIRNYQDIFDLNFYTILSACMVFLVCSLLSGIYPALLIAFKTPIRALKGKLNINSNGINIRKGLVIFQFSLSAGLMISVFVLRNQFQFMESQNLRINVANTVVLKAPSNVDSTYISKLSSFKKHLKNLAIVKSVTTSSSVPGDLVDWQGNVRQEKDKDIKNNAFSIQVVDDEFLKSYNLHLLAGRNFELAEFPDGFFGSKIESIAINETGVKRLQFGTPENAIGKLVYWGPNKCRVIAVVNDFHQNSLKSRIEPTLFTANYGPVISMVLNDKTYEGDAAKWLNMIQKTWKDFFPNNPFDYFLLEDHVASQYTTDKQFADFFNMLCALACLVSGMGLFGLSLYATKQRVREVGIRKALGASISQVTVLLSRDFLILVIISSFVAIPITYFCLIRWLDNYAYHISLTLLLFVVPIIIILAIALITVSFQSISVARINPAKILSSE